MNKLKKYTVDRIRHWRSHKPPRRRLWLDPREMSAVIPEQHQKIPAGAIQRYADTLG